MMLQHSMTGYSCSVPSTAPSPGPPDGVGYGVAGLVGRCIGVVLVVGLGPVGPLQMEPE